MKIFAWPEGFLTEHWAIWAPFCKQVRFHRTNLSSPRRTVGHRGVRILAKCVQPFDSAACRTPLNYNFGPRVPNLLTQRCVGPLAEREALGKCAPPLQRLELSQSEKCWASVPTFAVFMTLAEWEVLGKCARPFTQRCIGPLAEWEVLGKCAQPFQL